MNYEVIPISFRYACNIVSLFHRHHKPPQGHKFSLGLEVEGKMAAIVIVGRPVARGLDDGRTLEITRICVIEDGIKNCVSILLGAVCKAAKAMGYQRIVTYILEGEHGSSLKASNFQIDGMVHGRTWSCESRPRQDNHPLDNKVRYLRML